MIETKPGRKSPRLERFVLEIVAGFVKFRIARLMFWRMPIVGIVGFFIASGASFYSAGRGMAQYEPPPTVPEMERHLEFDDRRFDKIEDHIDQKFKELNDNRDEQRKESQKVRGEMNDKLNAIYYGIWGVGAAVAAGVAKFAWSRKRDREDSDRMDPENMRMLLMLARALDKPKEPYRDER